MVHCASVRSKPSGLVYRAQGSSRNWSGRKPVPLPTGIIEIRFRSMAQQSTFVCPQILWITSPSLCICPQPPVPVRKSPQNDAHAQPARQSKPRGPSNFDDHSIKLLVGTTFFTAAPQPCSTNGTAEIYINKLDRGVCSRQIRPFSGRHLSQSLPNGVSAN